MGHLAVDAMVIHPLPPSQSHTTHSSACLLSAANDANVVLYEDVRSAAGWEFSQFEVSTFSQVWKGSPCSPLTTLSHLGPSLMSRADPLCPEQMVQLTLTTLLPHLQQCII